MAAKLSRSWSFFSGRRPHNGECLSQDYQPTTPGTRVNLQDRFSQEKHQEGRWRRGPLLPPPPPPPTRNNTFKHHGNHAPEAPEHHPTNPNNGCADKEHSSGQCEDEENGYEEPYEYPSNNSNLQRSHPHHSQDCCDSNSNRPAGAAPSSVPFPRRSLRKLPSGIAPLWNNIQDNVSQLKPQTSRFINEGGRKMNRALQGVRTSFSSFTQMFRNSTRRRYKLDGGTPTRTPRRTPGKLYSPFDMSTPATPHSYAKGPKRLQNASARRNIYGNENRGVIRLAQHHAGSPLGPRQWNHFHSPSQALHRDITAVNRGLKDLEHVSSGILHNEKEKWIQFQ
ncbi:uncharacterized protein [Procambarus clarkii]|uniref:uncharacterized protein n=1 Tax=Procambarus clarkii TaxID=6728 RepID=UPI001E67100D|nr:uncharacterized protein LOC123768697 [Procambarus clarkii]